MIFVVALVGCTSSEAQKEQIKEELKQELQEERADQEEKSDKIEYNFAYVKFYVFLHDTELGEEHFAEDMTKFHGTFRGNTDDTVLQITDYEYCDNGTIILYLKDGRTIQTANENVMLVHEIKEY